MKKTLKKNTLTNISRLSALLVVVIVIVIAGALTCVYTETGTEVAILLLKQYLPGKLQIKKIRGTLSRHVELDNISYQINGKRIDITSAAIDWQFHQLIEQKQTTLTVAIDPGEITFPNDAMQTSHKFKGGTITTDINHSGAITDIDIDFIDQSKVKGKITTPSIKKLSNFSLSAKIKGEIHWNFPNIQLAQQFIPKIDQLKGKLNTTIFIDGTIKKPTITMSGKISQSSFGVPNLQSLAKNLTLTARTEKKKIHFTAETNVGEGHLKAVGITDLGDQQLGTQFTLTGENARVIDMPLTQISANPKLDFNLSSEGILIKGDIFIPHAEIKTDRFSDTETLPDELVIVSKKKSNPKNHSSFDITSEINLTLGSNIHIAIDGLKGKVSGNMKISEQPNKPTTATGQLKITEGTFALYGTIFAIKDGRLNYHGGPITNPGLDIRATRTFKMANTSTDKLGEEDITFGVEISGTAKQARYTLFSEPEGYSQADILSYLFTGQPLSKLDGNDNKAQLLLQAAALINIGGNGQINNLRNQIKNKLGLSDLDIQTTAEIHKGDNTAINHTAFVLGKYLSPKLYLKYSFDILDHTNKLNVRYFLNKHWSIQTQSSNSPNGNNLDNGLDVLYSIERN